MVCRLTDLADYVSNNEIMPYKIRANVLTFQSMLL